MANRFFLNIGTAWNDTNNWSTTSGGAGGASVPGSADVAIFDNNSGSCNVDVAVDVLGLDLQGGATAYTGTLDMNGFGLTVGSTGFNMDAGTFLGSNQVCDTNGPFNLSGGSFTSTSNVWAQGGDFIVTGGTYLHNSGKIILDNSVSTEWQPGGITLNDVEINKGSFSLLTGGTCTVIGKFDLTALGNGFVGAWNIQGDMTTKDSGAPAWPAILTFNGTGNQTIDAAGGIAALPSTVVDKVSGTLFWKDTIEFEGNTVTWKYIQGTMDFTNLVKFIFRGHAQIVDVPSTLDFTKPVEIDTGAFNISVVNGPWTIKAKLTVKSTGSFSGDDTILECYDDIDLIDAGQSVAQRGRIILKGTANQIVDAPNGTGGCCSIKIDKPSGTVTFKNRIVFFGSDASSNGEFTFIQADDVIFDPSFVMELEDRHKVITLPADKFVIPEIDVQTSAWDFKISGVVRTKRFIITTADGIAQGGKLLIDEFMSAQDTSHTGFGDIEFRGPFLSEITAVASNDMTNGTLSWNNRRGRCTLLSDFNGSNGSGPTQLNHGSVLDLNGFTFALPLDLTQNGWIDNAKAGSTLTVTGTHTRGRGSYIGNTKETRFHNTRNRIRRQNSIRTKRAIA